MTDAFEERLRTHLATRAEGVTVDPDPDGILERAGGRFGRRGRWAVGAAVVAVVLAGAGVLTGVNLSGAGSTAASRPSTTPPTLPGRAGASLAPGSGGPSGGPAVAGMAPYTLLFTRTTGSGVVIRGYAAGDEPGAGCPPDASCPVPVPTPVPSPVPSPCPKGAMCAQPGVAPQAQGVAGVGVPETLPAQPGGSGTPTTVPLQPGSGCGQLVLEFSTGKAVGSGTVPRPLTTAPGPDTVEILGRGSFGTPEGAPVGWVAVWTGNAVASVRLSAGGAVVDAMASSSGLAVLAVPGNATLDGTTVVGADQNGAVVATLPAGIGPDSTASPGCSTPPPSTPPPSTPPTSTTTTPSSSTTTVPTTVITVPPSHPGPAIEPAPPNPGTAPPVRAPAGAPPT